MTPGWKLVSSTYPPRRPHSPSTPCVSHTWEQERGQVKRWRAAAARHRQRRQRSGASAAPSRRCGRRPARSRGPRRRQCRPSPSWRSQTASRPVRTKQRERGRTGWSMRHSSSGGGPAAAAATTAPASVATLAAAEGAAAAAPRPACLQSHVGPTAADTHLVDVGLVDLVSHQHHLLLVGKLRAGGAGRQARDAWTVGGPTRLLVKLGCCQKPSSSRSRRCTSPCCSGPP